MDASPRSIEEWEAPFRDGIAARRGVRADEDRRGQVHVVEEAPPQPHYVRTEHGPYHGLVLFTGGEAEGEDRLAAGETHFDGVRPGDLHVYSRARNEEPHQSRWTTPISFVSVMLPPGAVADACRGLGQAYDAMDFVSRFSVDDPMLEQLLRQLARELRAATVEDLYTEHLLQMVAAHLVRYYAAGSPPSSAPSGGLPAARLRRVRAYIDAHLGDEITVADLAAVACYSKHHFSRVFKQSTGRSPYAYVIERRMQAARRQLEARPDASVAAIGREVGYPAPSHFSRQFKAHHGCAPITCQQEARA